MHFHRATALLFVFALAACGRPDPEPTASRQDAVIYGQDDRKDVYAHPDPRMRAIANQASVVLVWPPYLDETNPANVVPSSKCPTLGKYQRLCATEPFRDDPAMGSCSGALIDDDLVLTAGHCMPTLQDCADARIVFNWQRTSATTLHPMTKDDVFRCTERLAFMYETVGNAKHDYAIIRLDRSAAPRFRPTAVRRTLAALPLGNGIGIIGYGSGIPAKIETGAHLLDPGGSAVDYFVHTSDAYSGNSGSPVFDLATYEIAGILVRGTADDFVDSGTCNVNHVCPPDGGLAEGCTGMSSDYAPKSVAVLCADAVQAARYPRLCAATSCGNGRCEASETLAACPADCTDAPDAGDASDAGEAGSTGPVAEDTADASEAPAAALPDATVDAAQAATKAAPSPVTMTSGCHASPGSSGPSWAWAGAAFCFVTALARRRRR